MTYDLSFLVIPAAGLGTRMKEVSQDLPKELLPVGDRPAIQYSVDEGISAGIENIIIVISKDKEIIREYFKDFKGTASINFVYQKELLGEMDAISYAGDIASGHAVAVLYPDSLYMPSPGVLKRLKQVYKKYNKDVIALTEITSGISRGLSNTGRIDVTHLEDDVYKIEKFYKKTRGQFVLRGQSELRACGIYISGPYLFDYIKRARKVVSSSNQGELTDITVRQLAMEENGLLGCRLPGRLFDIGNPDGYRQCVNYIKEQRG